MGIRRIDHHDGSAGRVSGLVSQVCYRPGQDAQGIGTFADPSLIVVGEDLIATLATGFVPILRHGITLTYTDAAGADFSGSVRITGVNGYGERMTEDIAVLPNVNAITASQRAWLLIERIDVLTWTAPNAADTLDIGWENAGASNAERIRIGFPWKVRSADDFLGLMRCSAVADVGDRLTVDQLNTARGTFTVSTDDATPQGREYRFIMNPNARHF